MVVVRRSPEALSEYMDRIAEEGYVRCDFCFNGTDYFIWVHPDVVDSFNMFKTDQFFIAFAKRRAEIAQNDGVMSQNVTASTIPFAFVIDKSEVVRKREKGDKPIVLPASREFKLEVRGNITDLKLIKSMLTHSVYVVDVGWVLE